jgi:iron complex transport system substrate-binding protein
MQGWLRTAAAAAAVVAVLGAAGCRQPSGSRQPHDAAGGKVPKRIISIVPAVTEMLFAIGAGPEVIAVSSFDTWPPEVTRLEKVGALLDPDVERIIQLHPDLVVVYGTDSDLGAQLQRAGIRTFPYVLGGLDNVTRTMRALGKALGRETEADRAAARIEESLDAIRTSVAGKPRPRTLLVFGREPGSLRAIDASGGVGFLHDILELAGGDDVFASEHRESLRIGVEAILAAAPEAIVELQYGNRMTGRDLERERAVWNALPSVPAVRDGRVYLLAGNEFVVPGPRVVDAAAKIADVLHPDRRR